MKKTQVEDVTDAQARATKGKLPRNIVYSLATVAAVDRWRAGVLLSEPQPCGNEREGGRAESRSVARPHLCVQEQGNSLDQEIRKQQEEARAEAARQKALAGKQTRIGRQGACADGTGLSVAVPRVRAERILSRKNKEDTLFTAPIFKSAGQLKTARASRQHESIGLA
ncbi:hypothetical protein [Cupriavidus sp. D39]|uniref:hypothetical protein n=1 Tax=Cupriavidus sp. D39 TaxID=2997877 RepID=UPI00226EB027|nr:hypothetical protein [Cupriavidus sp. D39]MCY0852658.1 hypothetical protein [Cupriavidus sp. D39]